MCLGKTHELQKAGDTSKEESGTYHSNEILQVHPLQGKEQRIVNSPFYPYGGSTTAGRPQILGVASYIFGNNTLTKCLLLCSKLIISQGEKNIVIKNEL